MTEPEPATVDVSVRGFLTVTLYTPGDQRHTSRTILVTGSRSEAGANGPAEVFIGVDGETAERIEIAVSYPDSD